MYWSVKAQPPATERAVRLRVRAHQLARLLPGLALADRQRAGLQGKGGVSIQISHGAIMAARVHSCKSACHPMWICIATMTLPLTQKAAGNPGIRPRRARVSPRSAPDD